MTNKTRVTTDAKAERVRVLARDRKRRQRDAQSRGDVTLASDVPVPVRRGTAPKPDERRIASRTKRDRFSAKAWGGRLANPDPTLTKFAGGKGIALYSQILHQFPNVAGYLRAWADDVTAIPLVVKAARPESAADQVIADAAAARASRAWTCVRNRFIAMQRLLFGRFYGFARAEKVARYDERIAEWIPELYDVPQESWLFDDDGREYLVTSTDPSGIEVDPEKFVHFQWGSSDTKYGEGDGSPIYLALWKIQKLETMALQRIEDNESTVIVHIPAGFDPKDRTDLETAYADEFRRVILIPAPNEQQVRTELPTLSVTTSGAAGRQEYEGVRFYERWIQTFLLGAPQTGDKSMGTGKLENVRKEVWSDKTPLGAETLAQTLTQGWMQTYCDWNLADMAYELRPRFEFEAVEVTDGLSGAAALEARSTALDLVAKRIPDTVAIELWGGLGLARPRAQAMADACVKERAALEVVASAGESPAPPQPETPDPQQESPAEDGSEDPQQEVA